MSVRSFVLWGSLGLLAIPVLAAAGYLSSYLHGDPATVAEAGDCVTSDDADAMAVVDRADAGAAYRVVARLAATRWSSHTGAACDAYPETTAVVWLGEDTAPLMTQDAVLCLVALGPSGSIG